MSSSMYKTHSRILLCYPCETQLPTIYHTEGTSAEANLETKPKQFHNPLTTNVRVQNSPSSHKIEHLFSHWFQNPKRTSNQAGAQRKRVAK